MVNTTVVIINWNGQQWLSKIMKTLDSMRCEVIVVDNASTDKSKKCFDKRLLKTEFPGKFKWIQLSRNYGFAIGNNKGAYQVKTKYILFLNNDVRIHKEFLRPMEKAMTKEVAIVGAKLLFGMDKTMKAHGMTMNIKKGNVQHAGINYHHNYYPYEYGLNLEPDHPDVNIAGEIDSVTAACMLIRKKVFDKVGGFEELYINGWEDTDLCLKVKELGWECFYEPKAVVTHYHSSSEGRFDNESRNRKLWEEIWLKSGRIYKLVNQDND